LIVPFNKDIWELSDRRNDFSLATDVAAKYPEKLKEMLALFDHEARKYKRGRQRRRRDRDRGRDDRRLRALDSEWRADVHLQLARAQALHDHFSGSAAEGEEHDSHGLRLRWRWFGQGWHRHTVRQRLASGRRPRREHSAISLLVGDTFDVGEDWGTPVSPTYKVPFKFTGNIKLVTIEAKQGDLTAEDVDKLHTMQIVGTHD
jgi:hypothetical protein